MQSINMTSPASQGPSEFGYLMKTCKVLSLASTVIIASTAGLAPGFAANSPNAEANLSDTVTKPLQEVKVNAAPSTMDTEATHIRDASPESSNTLSNPIVAPKSPFFTSDGKYRVRTVQNRKSMALALGGGGIRGAAHVGVLKVFEEEGIPIDYIVGNSAGSIVGGYYAAGVPLTEMSETDYWVKFRKSYVPNIYIQAIKMPISKVLSPVRRKPAGIASGKSFYRFLKKNMPEGVENIQDLKIPYSAVVTNLIDGQAYRISDGELATAMRASSSITPIVRPVKIGDKLCVDGGVRANLPASAAKDTGADVVIAVLIDEPLAKLPEKEFTHFRKVAERMTNIILAVADEHQQQFADIVIHPDLTGIGLFSKDKDDVQKAITAGESAARKAIPIIREKMNLPPKNSHLTETMRSQ